MASGQGVVGSKSTAKLLDLFFSNQIGLGFLALGSAIDECNHLFCYS
jgi:hypothetical protein